MQHLFPWFFFALMPVVGSLLYNVAGAKVAPYLSPYAFSFILNSVNVFICAIVMMIHNTQGVEAPAITFKNPGVWLAIMAGVGVTIIDIFYAFALRTGSPVASQLIWMVGGTILFSVFSWLFLADRFSWQALLGIGFALVGIILIIAAPPNVSAITK